MHDPDSNTDPTVAPLSNPATNPETVTAHHSPGARESLTAPASASGESGADRYTQVRSQESTVRVAPAGVSELSGYELGREIARGGMGVVYAARDLSLDREVAVKVMLPRMSAAEFERESKITARLPHPGVPPVYALGKLPDGRPFLAMKLIKGETLDKLLRARTDPTAERGRFVAAFEQICQAVGYAHAQGIVHRDLKPTNVMVGAFGEVQVMDWGLAKTVGAADADGDLPNEPGMGAEDLAATVAGQVKGTPAYMAPEQARGEPVDARADVFALGGILAAILTGKPPFAGNNVMDTIIQAASAELDSVWSRLDESGVDAELIALAKRCLAGRAEDRPEDGREVAEAVAAYRAGVDARLQQVEQERAVSAAEAREQRKRRRVQLALGAAVLLATLVGTAGSSVQAVRADRARHSAEQARHTAEQAQREAEQSQQEAEQARQVAEGRRVEAQGARGIAAQALLDTRVKVTRLDLATADRFASAGNTDAALLWYARAWWDDPDGAANESRHRLRLGLTLLSKPALVGLAVHDEPLTDARIDDAGTRVIGQTKSGKATLWDIRAGREIARLVQPGGAAAITLSRDGAFALTGGSTGTVRVWDGATGKLLRSVDHGAAVACVEWKPGGATFATAGGAPGVRFWNATDGAPVAPAPDAPGAFHIGFSADGARAVTATVGGLACVWDTASGEQLGRPLVHRPQDHYERLWNIRRFPVLSPNGRTVLTSVGEYTQRDYEVTAWDAETAKRLWATSPPGGAYSQTFSSDGKRLLLTGLSVAFVVDPATGVRSATVNTPRECQGAAFLAGGRVATFSTGGLIQVWNTTTNPPTAIGVTAQTADSVRVLTALPDGKHALVAAADGTARLYDLVPALVAAPLLGSGRANRVAFRRGNRSVAYSADGKVECEYGGTDPLRVGPRGADPHPVTIEVPGASVRFRDGGPIVTTTGAAVRTWDASTGKPLGPPIPLPVGGTAVHSGDGRRVAVSARERREVRVFDATTGAELLSRSFPVTEELASNAAVISADGRWLATGDFAFAGAVEVWDIGGKKMVARFSPHRGNLNALDLSADGSRLLVCSSDTTVRLWDARTGVPLGPVLRHPTFCRLGELAGDGRQAVTADSSGTVYLWDTISGERIGQSRVSNATVPSAVWFATDGRTLYYQANGAVTSIGLRPLGAPTESASPLLELATGQRIDPSTEGVEYLPTDTFTKAPEHYSRTFRAAREPLKSP